MFSGLPLFFLPLLLGPIYIYWVTIDGSSQSGEDYFLRSESALHKFDGLRRYDQEFGSLKLASNSYIDTVNIIRNVHDGTEIKKENATLLMLCRNWELGGVLKAMRSLEDRFNHKYNYDWVFLNEVPFDDIFIEATQAMASGNTKYGLIPASDWETPDWIDEGKYEAALRAMEENNVLYGGSKSYRNMCRFNSGFFFRQKLLDEYDYYFRVEPSVEYLCDITYDPFALMRERKKKYGFVITIAEYENTIPTLWKTVREFIEQNPELVDVESNGYQFITDGLNVNTTSDLLTSSYNTCHFWSNFEIGDLNFFRSEAYLKYFDYLDKSGGFYYERWGDAPVHSIAAALLLRKDEVHYFDDIGYFHTPYGTGPSSIVGAMAQRCVYGWDSNRIHVDLEPHSCLLTWIRYGEGKYYLN